MKKILAIVVGGNQLLFAIQAKHTIHKNDKMDIVYRKIDIDEAEAREVFDGVYRCKSNDQPRKIDAIKCFFYPQYAIKKYYADIDLDNYTDILFWHPDYLHYFIYKYSCYSKRKYNWHLLPEGLGVYVIDKYAIHTNVKYGFFPISAIIQAIDKSVWGYPINAEECVKSAYYIDSEYATSKDGFDVAEIPKFDSSDRAYLNRINRIFKYKRKPIDHKVLFLDGGMLGSRSELYDSDKVDNLLITLGSRLGRDNVILKRKHGIGMEQYSDAIKKSVSVYYNEDIPWELMCLNGDIDNCIIISIPSSAIILPYLFCGYTQNTYMINGELIGWKFDKKLGNLLCRTYEKIVNNSIYYRIVEKEEDIEELIDLCVEIVG